MTKQIAGILFFCLVCTAGRVSASSITFEGEGKVGVVEIHSPNLGDLWAYAGELNWEWAGSNSFFYTYCVDVNNWVLNPETVDVLPSSALSEPGVPDAGGKAAWLINTYAPLIHASGDGDDAAALQVAIWTALYDTGSVLNSGPFALLSADSTITQEAQTYLSALYSAPGGGYYTSTASWLDAPNGQGQDQMPPTPTPEPGSLVFLAMGLPGVFALTRRRAGRVKH
jgi:hypothetical protein